MSRRCSHCGLKGHNSRTCTTNSVEFKLFGVRLTVNNSSSPTIHTFMENHLFSTSTDHHDAILSHEYVFEGQSRKKGVAWTEEEHLLFLAGLEKLGRGDWRGISREFVRSRTPTQVASHAQKYFLSRVNLNKKRRKISLFDMPSNHIGSLPLDEHLISKSGTQRIATNSYDGESVQGASTVTEESKSPPQTTQTEPDSMLKKIEDSESKVVKPIPLTTSPKNGSWLTFMSTTGLQRKDPRSPLTLPSRKSAFHEAIITKQYSLGNPSNTIKVS